MDIIVPSFGESITEVQVGRLLVQSGSTVKEGQELVELETDKVNQTIAAPISGIVNWKVSQGVVLPIGGLLASIEPGAAPQELYAVTVGDEISTKSMQEKPKEMLSSVQQKTTRMPMSSLRKTVAQRLVHAAQNTAMLTTFQEVDLLRIDEMRRENKEEFLKRFQTRLGLMSFFVTATAQALQQYPLVNSYIDGNDIVSWQTIDIGVAVSTERGVVVPVLRQADTMSYSEIERTIDEMAERARGGHLTLHDIEGGTFTITNGGVFGSLFSTPMLNPPQSAILGMHKIQKRAVVVEDKIVIRPMMYLALTYDHRLIDGQEAIQFLSAIKKELEEPDRMLLGL